MGQGDPAEEAKIILRNRLTNPSFIFSFFSQFTDSNYSKLKYIISSSVTEACNNSVLLLGPRGCGKNEVLELVLEELLKEHPDMITVRSISLVAILDFVMIRIFVFCEIKLNGLLHSDNNCALKEISRQLCLEHQLMFSKMASFDDNSKFLLSMLRYEQNGKQRLFYSLLDALQSVTSQAVVVGVSCRLDADQLLEKRVRSRFSHWKLLFLPPSGNDLQSNILADEKFKEIVDTYSYSDSSVGHLLIFLFSAVRQLVLKTHLLSVENFKSALPTVQRQPKLEALKDCSILELYILVCMKRLEVKELELCNFNSVMKEYKSIHDNFQTSDYYVRNVCLRAFEHLLERSLIAFEDKRGHGQSTEFRPVKLLISWHQLHQGMRSNRRCPDVSTPTSSAILHKLMDREV
ncbi:origin recognition complex subunit 4 [Orobanche gracilis]